MNKLKNKKAAEKEANGSAEAPVNKARMPRAFLNVLNGTFLTRENVLGNMPFILFCSALMITYIGYGYHTERIVRNLSSTDSELKELRSEYITVRAKLETDEQQSKVADRIAVLGLKESVVPPVKIDVEKKEMDHTRTP